MNIVAEVILGRNRNTWLDHQKTAPPRSQFDDPFPDYMYEEMRQCYINCLDHSAIIAGCVVLEAVMKSTSYLKWFIESGSREHSGEHWNQINNKRFHDTIQYALSINLISDDLAKRLQAFRDQVRNKYLHGETPKQVKEATWRNVGILNVETGQIKIEDMKLDSAIHLQELARIKNDRELAPYVVNFVHGVMIQLYKRLDDIKR